MSYWLLVISYWLLVIAPLLQKGASIAPLHLCSPRTRSSGATTALRNCPYLPAPLHKRTPTSLLPCPPYLPAQAHKRCPRSPRSPLFLTYGSFNC
ncbi:hypothetical protein AM228_00285 [Planktothricoides sp. SR001]|nr:hypothetical protein AM228_00285 [Planktothricoides sp. SR001]